MPAAALRQGFDYIGEKVSLESQAVGIFKPRQMERCVLSIKTTMPRKGRENIYNDHQKGDGYYHYSLQQGDVYGGNNKYLWASKESKSPFIYFHAIAPAIYKALWPCFVYDIFPEEGEALIVVGEPECNDGEGLYDTPDDFKTKYLVRESKVRLHQASFREAVLSVYGGKCAVSGLSVSRLIEAAHVIPDSEVGELQRVTNGIALSRVHHKAYDSNLIGIDPDYKLHVSDKLLAIDNDDFLQVAIKSFNGTFIALPHKKDCWPDKESIEWRFEGFKEANGL